MSPQREAPETLTQTADDRRLQPMQRTTPVLVVVGSAATGGAPGSERLIHIGRTLEIGRGVPRGTLSAWNVDDPWVSGLHARLEATPAGVVVHDLGSRNGTFVDGIRVAGATPLREGALLSVGGHVASFRRVLDDEFAAIREDLADPLAPVATASPTMAMLLRKLRRRAKAGDDLLLTGETGVGKEVYARALHRLSGRPGGFVAVNCAAIPADLLESELYGYARGAHSQATQAKPGLIEEAVNGTVFLDEIAEMPPSAQAKLLRFLQERESTPLGATRTRRIDVRVVAATNAPVRGSGQKLREDVLARFGAEPLVLPPLRERREDIGALAAHFLAARRSVSLQSAAFFALCFYDWPRNVRELEKVVAEAALDSGDEPVIKLEHLPRSIATAAGGPVAASRSAAPDAAPNPSPRRGPRPAPSRAELEELLRLHRGNIADVAKALDRKWGVVWRWLRKEGLDAGKFKDG